MPAFPLQILSNSVLFFLIGLCFLYYWMVYYMILFFILVIFIIKKFIVIICKIFIIHIIFDYYCYICCPIFIILFRGKLKIIIKKLNLNKYIKEKKNYFFSKRKKISKKLIKTLKMYRCCLKRSNYIFIFQFWLVNNRNKTYSGNLWIIVICLINNSLII